LPQESRRDLREPRAFAQAIRRWCLDDAMSAQATDWAAWHADYEDPTSALSRRLRVVRDQIRRALPFRLRRPFRVLSLCAGRGDDLIGVLRSYAQADLVQARLVELDPRNIRAMASSARAARLALEIVQGDAGDPTLCEGAVPADLVLLCGVLGNVADDDAHATVRAMPQLCETGGTVVWTRSRRPPDLTPQIRRWFAESGFEELAFVAPEGDLFSVGACRFLGEPQPLSSTRLFRFIR
jgi:hypothetical protein